MFINMFIWTIINYVRLSCNEIKVEFIIIIIILRYVMWLIDWSIDSKYLMKFIYLLIDWEYGV